MRARKEQRMRNSEIRNANAQEKLRKESETMKEEMRDNDGERRGKTVRGQRNAIHLHRSYEKCEKMKEYEVGR